MPIEPGAARQRDALARRPLLMRENAGNGVREVERRQVAVAVPVALHGDANDGDAAHGASAQGNFAEPGGVAVALAVRAERVPVTLRHPRRARHHQPARSQLEAADRADVEATRGEVFHPGSSVGREAAGERAARAIFERDSAGDEERMAAFVLPEEPRACHDALVAGHVGPAIVVAVGTALPVAAAEEGVGPLPAEAAAREEHGIGAAEGGTVEQELPAASGVGGLLRDEIDDAAECRAAVQRARGTLDDLDLAEIHRRHLEEAETACLAAVEWQAIGQKERVAAAEALDADVGAAEARRRVLHPHAARLVEHHRDVAGGHEELFLDLLLGEHLDAEGLVFDPALGSRRADRDLFDLDGLGVEPEAHARILRGPEGDDERVGPEADPRDAHRPAAGWETEDSEAGRTGGLRIAGAIPPTGAHHGVRKRHPIGRDRDAECGEGRGGGRVPYVLRVDPQRRDDRESEAETTTEDDPHARR